MYPNLPLTKVPNRKPSEPWLILKPRSFRFAEVSGSQAWGGLRDPHSHRPHSLSSRAVCLGCCGHALFVGFDRFCGNQWTFLGQCKEEAIRPCRAGLGKPQRSQPPGSRFLAMCSQTWRCELLPKLLQFTSRGRSRIKWIFPFFV